MNLFTYLIFVLLFIIGYINCTDVQLIYYSNILNEDIFKSIVEDFNEKSMNNGWDINLIKNYFSKEMSSDSYVDSLESNLNSKIKSDMYDIIVFDMVEKNKINKYLVDLNTYLDKSKTNGYVDGIAKNTTMYNEKISSIPLFLEYNMLYYNKDLLDQYGKDVPKSWYELYETAKYIVSEEKNKGREIVGFTSELSNSEEGFGSFYEYIYSFRNNTNEPFPRITNPEVEEAMEHLMLMKEEFGDELLLTNSIDINGCLKSSNCLFVKSWNNLEHEDCYDIAPLPGRKDGISGSIINGYNIGINDKISEERKEVASKIIEYFASLDFQKDVIMELGYQSALKELYENDSICQSYSQCQTLKNIQYIFKPMDITDDYNEYSKKFRDYLMMYLMNVEELQTCLQNIDYLTRIFYQDSSYIGYKVLTYIIGATDLLILYSYCYAHTKKHIKKFQLFNNFYWFIYLFGLILIMSYGFTGMGELSNFKCRIRAFVLSLGFTLSNTLICIKLVMNFPDSERHFVIFMEKHFGLCVFTAVLIDIVLNFLVYIDPYRLVVLNEGNIMYNACRIQGSIGHMFTGFIYIYKIIIFIVWMIFIFIEWNIQSLKIDIRLATASLFISMIVYIIYAIFNMIHITGYREQFLIPSFMAYIFGTSNFFLYFFSRFFIGNETEDEKETSMMLQNAKLNSQKNLHAAYEKYSSSMSLNQTGSGGPVKKMSLTERLVGLHNYGDEIKKSCDLSKKSNSSSTNDLSNSKYNLKKYSRSSNNISLAKLDEVSSPSQRRVSQIDVIPENKIAEIFNPNNDRIKEDIDDVYINRSRTRSYDNVLPNFNRITRINSTPNKKFLGAIQGNMRSTENFSNSRFIRKGSNISFNNVNPPGNSNTNLSRHGSVQSKNSNSLDSIDKLSHKVSSHGNVSAGIPYNAMSSDFVSFNSSNVKNSYFDDSSSMLSESTNNRSSNKKINAIPSAQSMNTHSSFKSAEDTSDE